MPIRRSHPPEGDDRDLPRRHGHGHGPNDDVLAQANDLLGYDVVETKIIEADADFHARIVKRLASPDRLVPVEQVFGRLEDD
jgi:hypothetical protein